MGSIYQSIELLSKEKGIETQIVLDAVKDALLVVARKHYRKTASDQKADMVCAPISLSYVKGRIRTSETS